MTPRQRQSLTMGWTKIIDGKLHKRCAGPAHEEPVYLPATDKYFYRFKNAKARPEMNGKLRSQCRLCHLWKKVKVQEREHGLVPALEIKNIYIEAINRIGLKELSRRTTLNKEGLRRVITGETKSVQKESLKKVMLELVSMQRNGESNPCPRITWQTQRRLDRGSAIKRCAGCGIELDGFLKGCRVCMDRKTKRTRRINEAA